MCDDDEDTSVEGKRESPVGILTFNIGAPQIRSHEISGSWAVAATLSDTAATNMSRVPGMSGLVPDRQIATGERCQTGIALYQLLSLISYPGNTQCKYLTKVPAGTETSRKV